MPHEIFDFVYKIRIFPKINPDFKWGFPLFASLFKKGNEARPKKIEMTLDCD